MKGGVTCCGAMFCRKTKSAIIVRRHGEGDSLRIARKDTRLSALPGRDTSITLASDDMRSDWRQVEFYACVPNDVAAPILEGERSVQHELHDLQHIIGTDINASDRPVVNSSLEDGMTEEDYEGENEGEDMFGRCTPQEVKDCASHPSCDDGSDLALSREYPVPTEASDNDSAAYNGNSVMRTYGSNVDCQNCFAGLETASGHASDPGVYLTKQLESICRSPMLTTHGGHSEKNETKHASVGAPSEPESVGHPDSLSPLSGNEMMLLSYESSSAEGEGRNVSSKECVPTAGRPSSEDVDQCNLHDVMFKPAASSQAMVLQKRKPWWKVFLVSSRDIHREVNGGTVCCLSEGDVGRLSPGNWDTSDMEARNRLGSPFVVNEVVSDIEKELDTLHPVHWDTSDMEAKNRLGSPFVLNEGVSDSEKELDNLQGLEKGTSPVRTHIYSNKFLKKSCSSKVINSCPRKSDISGIPLYENDDSALNMKSSTQKWDSFTGKKGLSRVEEWVSSIHPIAPLEDGQTQTEDDSPESPTALAASFFGDVGNESEDGMQAAGATIRGDGPVDADVEMAKLAARSVNPLSTVAHFSGVGLKVIPSLGMFGSLKVLNLSANSFVRVIPGCLPRSLHSLDISRNNIVVIEGLRELTRLRVLNLSLNRISRIGNGLSSCTSLKEVYLAENKISEVEGLHRLSKLVVLDLSFNKLTTTKSLGQIAANYKSLQALNLLGNAVHSNLGDEQMRRFVTGVSPQLVNLNKQPLKSLSNRETLGKELKASGKSTAKPSKRGSGHQFVLSHRRTHSGGVSSNMKSRPGMKAVTSPVIIAQGTYLRKPHLRNRSTLLKELPKGFLPISPTAKTPIAVQSARIGQSEVDAMHRLKTDGLLFCEGHHWCSSTVSGASVHTH